MSLRPHIGRHYCEGELVMLSGQSAVVLAAFPDGFHTLRLESSGRVTGAHFLQLRPLDRASRNGGPFGRASAA